MLWSDTINIAGGSSWKIFMAFGFGAVRSVDSNEAGTALILYREQC